MKPRYLWTPSGPVLKPFTVANFTPLFEFEVVAQRLKEKLLNAKHKDHAALADRMVAQILHYLLTQEVPPKSRPTA